MNERDSDDFSKFFNYLPSISDRKEAINQWKDNPSLKPFDVSYDFIQSFSPSEEVSFQPHLLNSLDKKVREPQVKILCELFKHIAISSNQNLERNIRYLNLERNSCEMEWTNSRFDSSKFKLTY